MPTPKKRASAHTPRSTKAIRPAVEAFPDDPPPADQVLSDVIEQFGGGPAMYVRIERRDARGNPEYLGTVDLTPELLDDVKTRWGGGKYRGRVVDADRKYRASLNFAIAGGTREAEEARRVELAAATEPAGLTRIETVMAGFAESIKALIESQRSAPASHSTAYFLETVKLVREMMPAPAPAPAGGSPADMFATLNSMLDLRERIADTTEARQGDGFASAVEKGIGPLVSLVNRKLDIEEKTLEQRKEARVRARLAPVAAVPADPVAALAATVPGIARTYLANAARSQKDATLYAELVLDQLPDVAQRRMPTLLEDAEFSAKLCAAVPQWAPYPAWFASLADAMRELLSDDGTDDDDASAADVEERTG
jgi:hypothetical protein